MSLRLNPLPVGEVACCICKHVCDGTVMRNRSAQTVALVTDEIIPRINGVLALCHQCQRSVYFAGGFLKHLANVTRMRAVASFNDAARFSDPKRDDDAHLANVIDEPRLTLREAGKIRPTLQPKARDIVGK